MDIQATKIELIQLMLNTQKEQILQQLKNILEQEENHISIEQYNKELDEADAEIGRGEFYTHQEAVQQIKGWRKK
ncbi:hypothetical protein MNBD_UNCLBAC01-1440 [hydrothermal vent metagenome]|uniref:Prevent host death protein, Phd antitoxin n=1 Tax=hydrothermal vent metagenome TaxID=652676 RepID=A0A3B1DG08_9ZZZZ